MIVLTATCSYCTCTRLETLDADIKAIHLQIVDLIDDDATALKKEQDAIDRHDDEITGLTIHLQQIIAKCSGPDVIGGWKSLSHKLHT